MELSNAGILKVDIIFTQRGDHRDRRLIICMTAGRLAGQQGDDLSVGIRGLELGQGVADSRREDLGSDGRIADVVGAAVEQDNIGGAVIIELRNTDVALHCSDAVFGLCNTSAAPRIIDAERHTETSFDIAPIGFFSGDRNTAVIRAVGIHKSAVRTAVLYNVFIIVSRAGGIIRFKCRDTVAEDRILLSFEYRLQIIVLRL